MAPIVFVEGGMNTQTYPWSVDDPLPVESGDLSMVGQAALQTVAYSDIFDYPLTAAEIHRYLVGVRASWRTVHSVLDPDGPLSGLLVSHKGYFLIPGREETVDTRLQRREVAASMWPRARQYGEAIGRLPFVRMVAVTGALAMDNVDPGTDIDYIVVTAPGRLWLCRALVVTMVRLAAQRGDIICPNYFLSEQALPLGEPNIFTAHELVQMIPIAGVETYRRMCRLNSWAAWFLPNAFDAPRRVDSYRGNGFSSDTDDGLAEQPFYWGMAEAALRTPFGSRLERWEMARKVRKLSQQLPERAGVGGAERSRTEVNFSADKCKGHFDSHRQRTLEAFSERLRSVGVAFPNVIPPSSNPTGEVQS
jgi:hypothetical protein